MDETGGGRPAKETTANLQNANGAPAVPISQKMKSGAKVTRYRQRVKGVSRIVEAFIRSSPKGGAPQTQGEQTAARYGSPRRRRHAPKQKAPPRRVELAKEHPPNGGYLERHAFRARILNAPARIITQSTPYIHPLQGWRSYPFSFCLFPFYFLKIKRLDVQKTRKVTKNGEHPIIFALFFQDDEAKNQRPKRTRAKPQREPKAPPPERSTKRGEPLTAGGRAFRAVRFSCLHASFVFRRAIDHPNGKTSLRGK